MLLLLLNACVPCVPRERSYSAYTISCSGSAVRMFSGRSVVPKFANRCLCCSGQLDIFAVAFAWCEVPRHKAVLVLVWKLSIDYKFKRNRLRNGWQNVEWRLSCVSDCESLQLCSCTRAFCCCCLVRRLVLREGLLLLTMTMMQMSRDVGRCPVNWRLHRARCKDGWLVASLGGAGTKKINR